MPPVPGIKAEAKAPRQLRDRAFLWLLQLLPASLARHLLFLLRSHPTLADHWGYHIRAIHFYEPLPDFREITEDTIRRRREFPAIDFNLSAQMELVGRLATAYGEELEVLAIKPEPEGFNFRNDYFSGLDAAVYYALIRDLKPARVIEIGSGNSTRIADKALVRNRAQGRPGELICIEPYPQPRLTEAKLEMRLIKQRVEHMELEFFASLQHNDILFIDSSHVVKFRGDVYREYIEILPLLKPGVWVHVHDIFFPHDYPAEWLIEKRIAFNEQYLLEAFLAFNHSFTVQLTNYWLALDYADQISRLRPKIAEGSPADPARGASFWMRKER